MMTRRRHSARASGSPSTTRRLFVVLIIAVVVATLLEFPALYSTSSASSMPSLSSSVSSVQHWMRTSSVETGQRKRHEPGLHLVMQYWITQLPIRQADTDRAFRSNLGLDFIAGVHILGEDSHVLDVARAHARELGVEHKIHGTVIGHRLNISDAIRYANSELAEGQIVVYAHADIQLDDSWKQLCPSHLPSPYKAFALSRSEDPTNLQKHGCTNTWDHCKKYVWSHDAFVFHPPLPSQLETQLNFYPNHWGAENVAIYYLQKAGISVTNPCHTLRIFHVDCKNQNESRVYPSRISNNSISGMARPSTLPLCPSDHGRPSG